VAEFTYAEFMLFVQSAVGAFVARVGIYFLPNPLKVDPPQDSPFLRRKLTHTVLYAAAMGCTNLSLMYVSYPTQALAKSCKILPVMLSGLFVKHIKYHWLQYLSVLMITIGVLEFQLIGGKTGGSDSVLGLVLLFGSLACDGGSGYLSVRPM